MRPLTWLLLFTALLLVSRPAWGQTPNPSLERARKLLDELRYAEAGRALEAARAQPANDRATLVQILEMQGVVAGLLQQQAKALAAFQALLVLVPEHRLTGDYPPRVMTPFFEAKAWVDEQGVLRLEPTPVTKQGALLESVGVRVTSDPLKMARAVRFHLSVDDGPWRQEEVPVAEGSASAPVQGQRVRWWGELLGERQAVLATLGSAEAPLLEPPPPPKVAVPLLGDQAEKEAKEASRRSTLRKVAYACLGAAVGAGAAGGYFGLRSRSARSEVEGAMVDGRGLTVGLTQREAQALDSRARSSAKVANILFGVAGATAIAGGTLWVLGAPVKVAATPTGVVVQGVLP